MDLKKLIFLILIVFGVIALALIFYFIIKFGRNLEKKQNDILDEAKKEAEKTKREMIFDAKEEIHNLKLEADKELEEKRKEGKDLEERLWEREKNIDRRDELLQKREEGIDERDKKLIEKNQELQEEYAKIEDLKKEQIEELEKMSGLSRSEAHDLIMQKVENDMNQEIAAYIKEREEEANIEADKKAKELLIQSLGRYSADVTNEHTVTTVSLPSDDMKGRLIGREGRNIRTIEAITGVDLIIDDTPEVIVLSSFNIYRREIARECLETLLKDGRIHPARIEEVYEKVSEEMHSKLMDYGNEALFELGISKMNKELIEKLGRLHFRTSYGQNVLKHSIEVGHLAGILAGELGENVNLAKRAGLLHDIGKAIDHDLEGSHVDLGAELAKKNKEPEAVINAIESHHGDKEATSVISALVAIADSISASRPGARSDTLENYLKRLEDLEKLANDLDGVDKCFALQAGREIRVMVKPDEVDDVKTHKLARELKQKIEDNLQYPGTIKVTVIRETRTEEEAK